MTRLVQHEDGDVVDVLAKGAGNGVQVVRHRGVDIHHVAGFATHDQLLHVIAGAGIVHAASLTGADDSDGVGTTEREKVGTFHGVHGDVDLRAGAVADEFAVIEHGSFVLGPFADDDATAHADRIEGKTHGVHSSTVAVFLSPLAEPAGCGKRSGFSHTKQFECQIFIRSLFDVHISSREGVLVKKARHNAASLEL